MVRFHVNFSISVFLNILYSLTGKYFRGRKVDYIMHVIEYQWRRLPHFHMAVRMKDVDTREY